MAKFTTGDGIEIRYEQRGSGPPVYVCHGGPNNVCDTLMADLGQLEDTFTLIFHDYRGSGASSSGPEETYRFDRLADDLDELRQHSGHDAISVLAHSMGGFVALQLALRHPESCGRLILVGTTPCGGSGAMVVPVLRALGVARSLRVVTLTMRFIFIWSWRKASSERTKAMYAPMSVTQEPRAELRSVVASAHPWEIADNDNAPQLRRAIGTIDLRDRLGAIHCPLLVLYGSRDAVMVVGGQMLEAAIPQSEVVVFPGVGHEPFVEAPEEIFPVIRQFLTDL